MNKGGPAAVLCIQLGWVVQQSATTENMQLVRDRAQASDCLLAAGQACQTCSHFLFSAAALRQNALTMQQLYIWHIACPAAITQAI